MPDQFDENSINNGIDREPFQEQMGDKDTGEASKFKLGRRLSAPARLKPINREVCDPGSICHDQSSIDQLDRQNKLRYSQGSEYTGKQYHREFHHHLNHHHQHVHLNKPHDHKSASPLSSSSSASDSAFSRSGSTLGGSTDGDQQSTNCFTNISLNSKALQYSTKDKDDDQSDRDSDHNEHSICNPDDHFQIIWRQLTYRVPERRLARWTNLLSERFKPTNENVVDKLEDGDLNIPTTPTSSPHKQRQVIFSNLNGCVKSGQLTAILGPSGAGKTTFLKCLTSNLNKGVSGSIDIVGGSSTSHNLKLCIIPQKDYLFDNLTVMENLLFASRIKNTKSDIDHKENVLRVASLLGIQVCMHLKASRLSGGQYKRVSIAQELLSQPDILILDEPTSGLDSLTCFKTVSVLRDLVNMSRTGLLAPLAIVMTIHQPQIKIFNLFHHVYILSSMGQCIYEGSPYNVVNTVADSCNLFPPTDDQNPASFIIDLGSEVYGSGPVESLVKIQQDNFNLTHPAGHGHVMSPHLRISDRMKKRQNHEHSFWLHTFLLIKRLWISMRRDSLLATTRIGFHVMIPFIFYFVYSQKSGSANACPNVEREVNIQELVSDSNIQMISSQHDELILTFENVSLFFLLLYSFSMCVLAVTALSFPLNMQILLKETSNGWYTMPRFVLAKTLADLPLELTMPVISVSIAYIITGQPSSYLCWRMLTVTAVMTLCSLISQTQGLLFGAYFMNNVQAAVFVSQASTLPWILLSGFTTRISELPSLLQWLSFGSIYRLGIESIVAVRYGYGMCPCDETLVNGTPTKIVGIPDQLKSVMSYYMDVNQDSHMNGDNSSKVDIFDRMAAILSRANTYGVDIASCNDVRPFIMSAREVDEDTLPRFVVILLSVLIVLKLLLFYVVGIRIR